MKLIILASILVGLLAGAAWADDVRVGDLQITQPWARATPRGAVVAGAYLTITNHGSEPDRFTGGSVEVASRFEIHGMEMDDGLAIMRPLEGGLEIKPGQTVELKPGSLHVMLVGLKRPLLQGQKIEGTLVFARAGKVNVTFLVQPIGASGPNPGTPLGQ